MWHICTYCVPIIITDIPQCYLWWYGIIVIFYSQYFYKWKLNKWGTYAISWLNCASTILDVIVRLTHPSTSSIRRDFQDGVKGTCRTVKLRTVSLRECSSSSKSFFRPEQLTPTRASSWSIMQRDSTFLSWSVYIQTPWHKTSSPLLDQYQVSYGNANSLNAT